MDTCTCFNFGLFAHIAFCHGATVLSFYGTIPNITRQNAKILIYNLIFHSGVTLIQVIYTNEKNCLIPYYGRINSTDFLLRCLAIRLLITSLAFHEKR